MPTTSGCVNIRHHEVQALRAVEIHVSCPLDLRFEATLLCCSQRRRLAPDIQQEPSRVDSDNATLPHEILPWGCHYRSLVSQAGHAWVAADLSADPQVARAKPRDGDGDRRGYGRLGSDGRRALRGRKRTGKGTTRVAGATGTGNARARVR